MLEKLKNKLSKVDLTNVKELVKDKAVELKEELDLVVEDPSLNKNTKVNIIINVTALACAIVAIQPIPFADIFILSPIQVVMITYMSKVLGLNTQNTKPNEILVYLTGTLGWGVLSQQVIIGLYKTVLPYAGGFTTIPLVYAATVGLGIASKTLIDAKLNNIEISKEELKRVRQDAIDKIKKQDRDWSPEAIKNQFQSISRKEFKNYKVRLISYDKIINKENNFTINDINSKKKYISERLLNYKNVKISDKVIYVIAFMDSEKTIGDIENTIAKLSRNEIKLSFTYSKCEYNIVNLCKLHIKKEGNVFLIEDIEVINSDLQNLINIFNNHKESYHLENKQIREKFLEAIDRAEYELDIATPWMNNHVVDDNLICKMQRCLTRGASIKIIYGMEKDSSNSNKRENRSDQVAEKLKDKFRYYGEKFKIKKMNSHYKVLICDEEFMIEGSYNFLSFDGKYEHDLRGEGASYNTDLNMIRYIRNRYFRF